MTKYVLDESPLFHEMVWYVKPDYRRERQGDKFYKYCEDELVKMGTKKMVMIHMATPKGKMIGRYYQSIGYKPLESHYIKDLETACQTHNR